MKKIIGEYRIHKEQASEDPNLIKWSLEHLATKCAKLMLDDNRFTIEQEDCDFDFGLYEEIKVKITTYAMNQEEFESSMKLIGLIKIALPNDMKFVADNLSDILSGKYS